MTRQMERGKVFVGSGATSRSQETCASRRLGQRTASSYVAGARSVKQRLERRDEVANRRFARWARASVSKLLGANTPSGTLRCLTRDGNGRDRQDY